MSTEKRNLQMDLETARKHYKVLIHHFPDGGAIGSVVGVINELLTSAFTIEELEGTDYHFQQSMGFKKEQGALPVVKMEKYTHIVPGADATIEDMENTKFTKNSPPFSLEVAQNYFKDLQAYPKCQSLINLNNLALHWYTKEQIEGKPEKKGFTWEESFNENENGYFINQGDSTIHRAEMRKDGRYINMFKTRKQAESALAFSQLTHIVAKYNEGKKEMGKTYCVLDDISGLLVTACYSGYKFHLEFINKEDAEISLEVNQALWKQYWMVD